MTIKIYSDRIDIGDFTLFEGNGGLQFDGVARAENYKGGAGTFQGSVSGYTSGGTAGPANFNTIDKFPFSTDSNATDVGDLSAADYASCGQSSPTYGYVSALNNARTTINKFPFASDTNSSSFTGLNVAAIGRGGQSSFTNGYATGGYVAVPIDPTARTNTIEKFSFSNDVLGSEIGDITNIVYNNTGCSSSTDGYACGGVTNVASVNTIDKFPFATDTNATDIGDLTELKRRMSGQSSTTHGYVSGGITSPEPSPTSVVNRIEKFPFASNANATDVGDLTGVKQFCAGQSSTAFGYSSGGGPPASAPIGTLIEKFPFATNTNASSVGSLTQGRYFMSGQQV